MLAWLSILAHVNKDQNRSLYEKVAKAAPGDISEHNLRQCSHTNSTFPASIICPPAHIRGTLHGTPSVHLAMAGSADVCAQSRQLWRGRLAGLHLPGGGDKQTKQLVTVEQVVKAHWAQYGRNFYQRYDYEVHLCRSPPHRSTLSCFYMAAPLLGDKQFC